jgi:tetratricopeptide (TPR) repeat protein
MKNACFVVMVISVALLSCTLTKAEAPDKTGLDLFTEAVNLDRNARSPSDLRLAAEKYEQALKAFRNSHASKNILRVTLRLSRLYLRLNSNRKAIELSEEAVAQARSLGDLRAEAAALNNLGCVYAGAGQSRKADESLQRAVKAAEEAGLSDVELEALNNLARLCRTTGLGRRAIEYSTRAVELARKQGNPALLLRPLNNLGIAYAMVGKHERAGEVFRGALQVARSMNNRFAAMDALNNLGRVSKSLMRLEDAEGYYRGSLAFARQLSDTKAQQRALGNMGVLLAQRGEYYRAIEALKEALSIAQRAGDPKGQIDPLNNLGNIQRHLGQYTLAAKAYEASLEIARKFNQLRAQARALNNLGSVFSDAGRYHAAVRNFEEALDLAVKANDSTIRSETLNNMAAVYSRWGRYGQAADYFRQDLLLSKGRADFRGQAITLLNLGSLYRRWGRNLDAIEYFKKSLFLAKKVEDPRLQAKTLMNMGKVYADRGESRTAFEKYNESLGLLQRSGLPTVAPKRLIANLYLDMGDIGSAEPLLHESSDRASMGRLHLLKREYEKARGLYESMLKDAERNRDFDALFAAWTGVGQASEAMGEKERAVQNYRKAIEATETVRSSLTPAQREHFFDVRIGGFYRTAPYEGLARVLIQLGRKEQAWNASEYTKARVFAESIARRFAGEGLSSDAELLRLNQELNDRMAALTKRLWRAYGDGRVQEIRSLEEQVEGVRKRVASHVKTLRSKHPLFAAVRYPEPMPLSQTALKAKEWALCYDVTDCGLLIYLTKGKRLVKAVFKQIARKELDELVRTFREPLEISSSGNLHKKLAMFDFASGRKLAEILLGEILTDLPTHTHVIIVPDDSLGVLPFEMLVLNDGGAVKTDRSIPYTMGAEFFGDRNPISYYQSISALTHARTFGKPKQVGKRALVIDDPVFSSDDQRSKSQAPEKKTSRLALLLDKLMSIKNEVGLTFPRLPLTGKLGAALKKLDPPNTDEYSGRSASKPMLYKTSLDDYRSMVFATHGYFGTDLPGILEPVLVLTLVGQPDGWDGFLRMSEVMGLKLQADIVTLTACQTGLGRRITGEGTMGMGRAFQYAGAKSVLVSLWSVAESPSVDLVEKFFGYLKRGEDKLEAIGLARRNIRASGYDHPFFWASFVLVGEID